MPQFQPTYNIKKRIKHMKKIIIEVNDKVSYQNKEAIVTGVYDNNAFEIKTTDGDVLKVTRRQIKFVEKNSDTNRIPAKVNDGQVAPANDKPTEAPKAPTAPHNDAPKTEPVKSVSTEKPWAAQAAQEKEIRKCLTDIVKYCCEKNNTKDTAKVREMVVTALATPSIKDMMNEAVEFLLKEELAASNEAKVLEAVNTDI